MRTLVLIFLLQLVCDFIFAQNLEKRNTIMVETNLIISISASYDRIVSLGEKTALMYGGDYLMGIGFGYGSQWLAPELSLLSFGPKHFLETGVLYVFTLKPDPEYNEDNSPGIRLAYRFQAKNGLTFRATANAIFNIDPIFMPSIGLGYSF